MADDRDVIEELRAISDVDTVHWVHHYLYLPSEESGNDVADVLRKRGFVVEHRRGADGVNWLVLAKSQMVPTEQSIADVRAMLEQIAEKNGGEYDGWEAEVQKKDT